MSGVGGAASRMGTVEAHSPPPQPGERGGVLLRVGGDDAFGFVPAAVARRLTSLSSLTPVPGARPPVAGIALADGAVVTVLSIGGSGAGSSRPSVAPGASPSRAAYRAGEDWCVPGSDRAVLCRLGGFDVALTGATVVATGVFDAAPDGEGVVWRGASVPLVDVRALYAQAEAATWAGRAVPPGPRALSVPRRPAGDHEGSVSEPEEQAHGRHAILPAAPGEDGERGSGA